MLLVTIENTQRKIALVDGKLKINLKQHSSLILKLKGRTFDSLRKSLSEVY